MEQKIIKETSKTEQNTVVITETIQTVLTKADILQQINQTEAIKMQLINQMNQIKAEYDKQKENTEKYQSMLEQLTEELPTLE